MESRDWLRGFVVVVLNAHDRLTCLTTCPGARLFLSLVTVVERSDRYEPVQRITPAAIMSDYIWAAKQS